MKSSFRTAASCLAQADLPESEAMLLLGHVLQRNSAWLHAFSEAEIEPADFDKFAALVRRRRAGEPIAYLTGEKEFWSLPLSVSKPVLIPRPETELLVDVALQLMPSGSDQSLLDLGTGSGAIALAIASERPQAKIIAVDRCADALAIAHDNANRLDLTQIQFLRSHWYREIGDMRFDLIVSNPPYISEGDKHLADLRFEPVGALVADNDGLSDLQTIVAECRTHLAPNGWLLVEHGYQQQAAVVQLFEENDLNNIRTYRDLSGNPRVVCGCHNVSTSEIV